MVRVPLGFRIGQIVLVCLFFSLFYGFNTVSSTVLHRRDPDDTDTLPKSVGPSKLVDRDGDVHSQLIFGSDQPVVEAVARSEPGNVTKPLRAFEINRPPRIVPDSDFVRACTAQLLEHTFENSYDKPAVTIYTPAMFDDPECRDPSKWVFIQLDVQGSAKGVQYDRLGMLQFDGVEVLRHSNPEPSKNGATWSFSKEMNKYFDIFRSNRTVVFDLPNNIVGESSASLHYILALTVFVPQHGKTSSPLPPLSEQYAVIMPLSMRNHSYTSTFVVGESVNEYDGKLNATTMGVTRLKLPHNARSALVEIYASGMVRDESWWGNLPSEAYDRSSAWSRQEYPYGRIREGNTTAHGPVRELQLTIDGLLAGVAQPFPVINSGGIDPSLWRTQVGIGVFDQPSYLLDITPFIGTLTDDEEHEFGLRVLSTDEDGAVNAWLISGNVQVQLDTSMQRTTGRLIVHDAPVMGAFNVEHDQYTAMSTIGSSVESETIACVELGPASSRTITIEGIYQLGSRSEPSRASVSQVSILNNVNDVSEQASSTFHRAKGRYTSMHESTEFLSYTYDYPLTVLVSHDTSFVDHGYHLEMTMSPEACLTFKEPAHQTIDVTQQAEALFNSTEHGSEARRLTSIWYAYKDASTNSFTRTNKVVDQAIVHDTVDGSLAGQAGPIY